LCGLKNGLNKDDLEKNASSGLNVLERTAKKILIFVLNRYPLLHKMDALVISAKEKHVFYKIDNHQEPILRQLSGEVKNYQLEDENYERLVTILKQNDKNEDSITRVLEKVDLLAARVDVIVKLLEAYST